MNIAALVNIAVLVISIAFFGYMSYRLGWIRMAMKMNENVMRPWRESILVGDVNYAVRINDYVLVHNLLMISAGIIKNAGQLEPFTYSVDKNMVDAMNKQAKYYEEKGHSKYCEKIVLPFDDRQCSCGYDNMTQPFRHT